MRVEERKAILLFLVLFFAWQILYLVDWASHGLNWLLAYSVVLAVLACFFILDNQKLTDLGFKKPPLWRRYVFIGFLSAAAYVSYWAGLSALIFPLEPKNTFPYGTFSVPYNLLFALVVGVVEETAFRGYILRNLKSVYSEAKAVFYSAFLFGIYHISLVYVFLGSISPAVTLVYWTLFVLFAIAVGLFLSYFYVLTKQTIIGTVTHHVSQIFLASFVPYSLAASVVFGLLLSTSAYVIFVVLLIFLKREGWLTDSSGN